MRAFKRIVLVGLLVSGCSVSEMTARSSGVGFNAPATTSDQTQPVDGGYRAALFNDLQG